MHEMGIAQEIIKIAIDSIPKDIKGPKVSQVNLVVGKLAAVVPESLRFCYDIAILDTPLAGSKLHIDQIPVRALCKDCRYEWIAEKPVFICEKCQGVAIEILSGRELDILSIEVDDPDGEPEENEPEPDKSE